MKTLNRYEVIEAYRKIVVKYGMPTTGEIRTDKQLIAKIAKTLCCFDDANIIYERGEFKVSPDCAIVSKYAPDYTFIGTAVKKEWYTPEQIKALHEVGFGYQFL